MEQNRPMEKNTALTADERTWGMIAHLSAFAWFLAPVLGAIIGPLVVWLAKRDQSAFVEAQAKEALNFNISVAIGHLICLLLVLVFVGILLGLLLWIAWLVLTIVAAIRASEGIDYRYPISFRFIK
jgi:uncharacterized Tic20 family protein